MVFLAKLLLGDEPVSGIKPHAPYKDISWLSSSESARGKWQSGRMEGMHVTNFKVAVKDSKGITFESSILGSPCVKETKENLHFVFGASIPISSPAASL